MKAINWRMTILRSRKRCRKSELRGESYWPVHRYRIIWSNVSVSLVVVNTICGEFSHQFLIMFVDFCMVQFVRPNLLGTKKEFRARFVNPIENGRYIDSTRDDVILMNERTRLLHSTLDGFVQVRWYPKSAGRNNFNLRKHRELHRSDTVFDFVFVSLHKNYVSWTHEFCCSDSIITYWSHSCHRNTNS